MKMRLLILVGLLIVAVVACKKAEDSTSDVGDKLSRPYCNDPDAINYNWDFPGTPDNSVCFYADELFVGSYTLLDSALDASYNYDTSSARTYTITITAKDRRHLLLSGYIMNENCTLNNVAITADRYYRASIDSTFLPPPDSVFLNGLTVCSGDTVSGYLSKNQLDTTKLFINFTVMGDTGLYFKKGTAIRQ